MDDPPLLAVAARASHGGACAFHPGLRRDLPPAPVHPEGHGTKGHCADPQAGICRAMC